MLIETTTRRELEATDFWLWANATIEAINSVSLEKTLTLDDFIKLLRKGEFSFENNLGYTKVKTTYRIIKQ